MQQGKTEKSSCGSKHNRQRVKGICAIRSQRMANEKKKKGDQTNKQKKMDAVAGFYFYRAESRQDATPAARLAHKTLFTLSE